MKRLTATFTVLAVLVTAVVGAACGLRLEAVLWRCVLSMLAFLVFGMVLSWAVELCIKEQKIEPGSKVDGESAEAKKSSPSAVAEEGKAGGTP